MDPLVVAAGTALVTAMATEAWGQAKAGLLRLWRRFSPNRADEAELEMDQLRRQILGARERGDALAERILVRAWQERLQRLLDDHPEAEVDLRRVVDLELRPLSRLVAGGSVRVQQMVGGHHVHLWGSEGEGPRAAAVVMNSLSRDTPAFTGRQAEYQQIVDAIADATDSGRVVAIHAIDGMAGVGKTAFAVHAGHRLVDRFPDGQILINLHAHTAGRDPVNAAEALASLLVDAGVPAAALPDELEQRTRLWRTILAAKRVLLILDNAAGHDQVEPLLPGAPGSLVLVTSRRRLTALDAVAIPLDTLTPPQAVHMFIRLAPRAQTDQDAVQRLVARCGHLPLAIALVAGRFRALPAWTLGDLERYLDAAPRALLGLRVEDRAVDAAFALSYQHLSSRRQRLFRLLGVHPGSDLTEEAAAALTGTTTSQATADMRALYDDHLIEERTPGRYRMHDLVRSYARGLVERDSAAERAQATEQLLNYFQNAATHANHKLRDAADGPGTPHRLALDWFRLEHDNLIACARQAIGQEDHVRVVGLAMAMAEFLALTGPWDQAVELHTAAIMAAQHLGDRASEATALTHLAVLHRFTSRYRLAVTAQQRALALYRDHDDRVGESFGLTNLGVVMRLAGDYRAAEQAHRQALAIRIDMQDELRQANSLTNLAVVQRSTGAYQEAEHGQLQALAIFRDLGNWLGQGDGLNNLGAIYAATGRYPAARETHLKALTVFQDLHNRIGQAYALNYLGIAHRLLGEYEPAHACHEQAMALYQLLGDRRGQAEAHNGLGTLYLASGNAQRALAHHRQALTIAQEVNAVHEQARSHIGLARYAEHHHDQTATRTQLAHALRILKQIGAAEAQQIAAEVAAIRS